MCPPVASKPAVVFLTDLSISTFFLWQLRDQQGVNKFQNKMDGHIQAAKVRNVSVCMCLYACTCTYCICVCMCVCMCVRACELV